MNRFFLKHPALEEAIDCILLLIALSAAVTSAVCAGVSLYYVFTI